MEYHCICNYMIIAQCSCICNDCMNTLFYAILPIMVTERLSRQQLAAWRAFLKVHAIVVNQIDHDLAAAEQLPLSSYDVLIELYDAPERRLRMHELAERVVLSRSGLTRLVDRLEAEGFLKRDRSGTDRRGAYAVITEQGIAALRHTWPVYARCILHYFARWLTPEEVQVMTAALERILTDASSNT